MKAVKNYFFLFTGFFLLLFSFFSPTIKNTDGQKKLAKQFEEKLNDKEKETRRFLAALAESAEDPTDLIEKYPGLSASKGFVLFVYESDSLRFWSDNTPGPPSDHSYEGLYQSTGWHYQLIHKKDPFTYIALLHIKSDYPYHNDYLQDKFNPDFKLPHYVEVMPESQGIPVKNSKGEIILSLQFPETAEYSTHYPFILFTGLILLTIGALMILGSPGENKKTALASGSLVIILLIIIRYFRIPFNEFESEIFNPVIYSNSNLISSLGVLIIETLTAFIITSLILRSADASGKWYRALLLIFISAYVLFIPWISASLIRDSSVHFELSELLSMNRYSISGLLLLFSIVLFLLQLLRKVIGVDIPLTYVLFFILLPVVIASIFFSGLSMHVLMLSISICFILLLKDRVNDSQFLKDIFFIFILCIPLTIMLERENEHKHSTVLRDEAANLSSARDPILEFLFADISSQVDADEELKQSILNRELKRDDIMLMLRHKYFKGYWNKFDVSFATYDTICNVVHKAAGKDKLPVYEQIINDEELRVDENLFYHQDIQTGRSFYLGKIDLSVKGSLCGVLYLEFNPLYFPEQPGYPELLLNKKKGEIGINYSWARYQNRRLLNSAGKFNYPLTYDSDTLLKDSLFVMNGYMHYIAETPNQLVITTKKEESLIQKASIFSFFFLFIVIVYITGLLVFGNLSHFNLNTESYRARIYGSFFLLIFFGLSLAGLATYYFIRQQDNLKNQELITDKMNSALAQMKDISESISKLDPVLNPFLDLRIDQVSNNLRSDINLYDLNGTLLTSSTPSIFEEKLLGGKMDPKAFDVLQRKATSVYLQKEQLGALTYLSGYKPLTTPDGSVLGYLNLPYFAGEKELKQDINSIVQALMNIYLILFLIAMGLAGFISSRLSEPLKLLKGKLSAINLGKKNELLEWTRNDEIGELISQYNKMVVQLADSAERLAMSERESAWKEMARQVAHEIKNPLTPMKLSVQYLQKAVNEKAPDLEERIDRFTRNLVDQIDTLSRISSEFSDFARLPEPVKEQLDIAVLLRGVIETFRNDEAYDLLYSGPKEAIFIFADKNQMIRVFNNIIKNATQALSDQRRGSIEIKLSMGLSVINIEVSDNGTGIPEEITHHIFTPKFTTKSAGMGLGLAMVRSIIESHDGKISFRSEIGKGTTFFISLPAVK